MFVSRMTKTETSEPKAKESQKDDNEYLHGKTPWPSLLLSFVLLILNGVLFSIYMTSAWPYLEMLDHTAHLDFFGYIVAAYSFGQMISSWLFGYWNQKTLSTRYPAICGLILAAIGNIIYGLLPKFSSNHKWYMLVARLLTGGGSGTLSIIRSYCAMASTPKDRTRAVSLATGSFVLGISIGPTIQSLFIPLGSGKIKILSIDITEYTTPAFVMVLVCIIGIVLLSTCFTERYAGIISDNDRQNPFMVIPKFDRIGAYSLIYISFVMQTVATSLETLSTPFAIALYDWNDDDALFHNGIFQTCSSAVDVLNYFVISFTKVQKVEKRLLLFFGLCFFTLYQLVTVPWPFYNGPLNYIKLAENSTVEDTAIYGGCSRSYTWCEHTTRVPLIAYAFCYIAVLGLGFPYISAPTGILFSEVLGPRRQGMMQGIFAFFGSLARCITPLMQTYLFEHFGYLYPNLVNLILLSIAIFLLVAFRRRLVPLKMSPKTGKATPYKLGTSLTHKICEGKEKSAWGSLIFCFILLTLNGLQFSIYMTSAWPYLISLDSKADLSFFGWIMSAYSCGQMFSCCFFGWWSQKTSSMKYPAVCGLCFTGFGNFLYGLLPIISEHQKWYMLIARLLTGWGTGTLSLIRSYCAMASTTNDRARVVSIGMGCFTLGISVGPTVQAFFVPLGVAGTKFCALTINMYTAAAFLMVFISVVSIVILLTCFQETYVGILPDNLFSDTFVVVPKFDRAAAFSCIFFCFVLQMVSTGLEVISTPLTVSMYNWTNEEAVFYNGILHSFASALDITNYVALSFTKLAKMDMRRLWLFGALCLFLYQLFVLPWPFYSGPLDYIKFAPNSTFENVSYSGGCFREFTWCSSTSRVPFVIYAAGYVTGIGFGFPYYFAPTGIIFSEVLGPRKQGMMQGLFAFFGSSARCITPLFQTYLFKNSGYLFPNLIHLTLLTVAFTLLGTFYRRLVPLKLVPNTGVATKYKDGIFYHLSKSSDDLESKKTPWFSISICLLLQTLNGIQFSVYLTSLWPYLTTLNPNANLGIFGWIVSAYSVGQLVSSFLFGLWNQKTMSATKPAICGLSFAAFGNLIYATLPLIPGQHAWFMLAARMFAGVGNGTLSVFRSYCAMACNQKDRAKIMPLGSGCFVLGLSIGPTIQALYIPLGVDGFRISAIVVNMYTAPAFTMVIVSMTSIFILTFVFQETYSGIISKDKKNDSHVVIPKFDKAAAMVCLYLYFVVQTSSMSMEIISTPYTVALYNWKNEEALFYNGILQLIACIVNVGNYVLISFTKIRLMDRRLVQLFGFAFFVTYYLINIPWPFYEGPLDYIELAPNSTVEDTTYSGGCRRAFTWCATSTRVPQFLYFASYILVLSFGMPYVVGPNAINYSEILGPRKQGLMMGLYTFAGSFARSITPLIQSFLFERVGYLYTSLVNLIILSLALCLLFFTRRRLVPLRLKPEVGVATAYKLGTFYRL
uniref:MFS domain-containing protein n=1 Tax=Syphacia muris TaxID=451379 RepID=A0A0N5AG21_9BILA